MKFDWILAGIVTLLVMGLGAVLWRGATEKHYTDSFGTVWVIDRSGEAGATVCRPFWHDACKEVRWDDPMFGGKIPK